MSHFTVSVIGPNPEQQLAPYQEETDDPRYTEFVDMEEELKKEYETQGREMVHFPDGERVCRYDSRFNETDPNDIFADNKWVYPEDGDIKEVPYTELYSFKEFVEEFHGYHQYGQGENAKYGYWTNPNAKWDWYVLGGRWSGYFKLKEGFSGNLGRPGVFENQPKEGYVDQALKGHIDFEEMHRLNLEGAEKRWEAFTDAFNEDPDCKKFHPYFDYGVENVGKNVFVPESRENYLSRSGSVASFAVLMDSQWHEKGSMGWFGCHTHEVSEDTWATRYTQLIQSLPDDTMISLYDCHI